MDNFELGGGQGGWYVAGFGNFRHENFTVMSLKQGVNQEVSEGTSHEKWEVEKEMFPSPRMNE